MYIVYSSLYKDTYICPYDSALVMLVSKRMLTTYNILALYELLNGRLKLAIWPRKNRASLHRQCVTDKMSKLGHNLNGHKARWTTDRN